MEPLPLELQAASLSLLYLLVLAMIAVPWFGSVWPSLATARSTGFLFAVSALPAISIVLYRAVCALRGLASSDTPVRGSADPVGEAHRHCFDRHRRVDAHALVLLGPDCPNSASVSQRERR